MLTCTCNKLLRGYLKHQIWEDYVYEHATNRMSNKLFEMKILFIPNVLLVEKKKIKKNQSLGFLQA